MKLISVPVSGTSRIGNTVSYTLHFFDPNDANGRVHAVGKAVSAKVQDEPLTLKTPDISHPSKVKMGERTQLTFNNPVAGSKIAIKDNTGAIIQTFDGSSSRNFEIDNRYLKSL